MALSTNEALQLTKMPDGTRRATHEGRAPNNGPCGPSAGGEAGGHGATDERPCGFRYTIPLENAHIDKEFDGDDFGERIKDVLEAALRMVARSHPLCDLVRSVWGLFEKRRRE